MDGTLGHGGHSLKILEKFSSRHSEIVSGSHDSGTVEDLTTLDSG
jgi:16S rRNA C1402 N4-methylase RsmH